MTDYLDQTQQPRQRHLLIDGLNLARGGGVVVMARLALAFSSVGYKVTVIASRDLSAIHFVDSGVEIIVESGALGALRSMFYRRYRLNAQAQGLGADSVLGFNYYSHVALPQVTYHINVIPFLPFLERSRAVGYPRAIMQSFAARAALRRSTANIFESHHISSLAMRGGIEIRNPAVAYIGADFVDETPSISEKRLSGPFMAVTSGAHHKRNDLTIAFFRRVLMDDHTARITFVGDADSILASLSHEDRYFAETSPAVTLHGYVDRGELYDMLAKARALVTFSELESFFMVAIEAMSVGCPVIAADNSSIRESVGTAGLLVPAGDVEAAVKVAQALDTPTAFAKCEQAGREWASAFEANKCAQGFVMAFERAILPDNSAERGADFT